MSSVIRHPWWDVLSLFKAGTSMCVIASLSVWMAGCTPLPQRDDFYAPTMPPPVKPVPADGAIFHTQRHMSLVTDPIAHQQGDILTIKLSESSKASSKASTSTQKNDSADLGGVKISGGKVTHNGNNLLSAGFDGSRQFGGKGDSGKSNSLKGTITVTVYRRLSNGNLMVRGEKRLSLNQGGGYIRIYGIVRPSDISPDNVVLSSKVANAHISYAGNGVIDDANTMGTLARFFNSPHTPY